jgi:hypothetical protein
VASFAVRPWAHRALGSLGLLVALLLVVTSAAGASVFRAVVSSNGTFSTSTLQLKATTAGPTNCYSTGTGAGGAVTASNTQPCTIGSPIPTGQLSNTASSSATTTLASMGNLNATSSTVASSSCGVAEFADSESATDWGGSGPNNALNSGGISYQSSGPLGSTAASFDGSTGWAETTTEYNNPQSFTVLVWLKTTTSGALLGFSSMQDPYSPYFSDRMLWVDPTGKLVWGLYNGANDEVTSPSVVNTGNWVFAAVTVGPAGATMYVNGTQVASNASYTAAGNFLGWWTLGWAYTSGWSDLPSSRFFTGSMAQVAVIPSQLSTANLATIYGEATASSYATEINTFSPASYWPLTDTGSVPYPATVPGTQTLADSSSHANTATASGGVSFGATGPTSLGTSSGIALDGSTGYVQTANSYANPGGFSLVAWFKTTTTSGGTLIGFDSSQNNETGNPNSADRLLWMDNTGHLVWAVYDNGVTDEITTPLAYNTGAWYQVVVEEGSAGAKIYVNDALVASNATYTAGQSYTGYWHIGWGYEVGWPNPPTSGYFNGTVSEVAVFPSLLTGTTFGTQIYTLYHETSPNALATYVLSLFPSAYWALQDSATTICGSTEVTVQETQGASSTCVYPPLAVGTPCPALSSGYLLSGIGTRTNSVAPTAASPVTVTIKMELTVASGNAVWRLHLLPAVALSTKYGSTSWSAGVSYPSASVEM